MGWREKVENVQRTALRTFPEPFTFHPSGAASIAGLSGIFREAHTTEDLGMEELVHSQIPTLDVHLSDLGKVPDRRADRVELTDRARTFEIEDVHEDGEGMAKLFLVEVPT